MTTTTPYADAIRRFAARDLQRLNVPGHSADPAAAPLLADFFGDDVLRYDVEPLLDGIDKGSDNPLEEARTAAARAWGARRTWFLTNGASEANRMTALALAAFGTPDEIVVAQRSAHSSFFDGIILGGLDPRFVPPTIDEHHGINHGVTPAAMRDALEGVDAKAAYIISPSYFGAVADIPAIARVVHDAGAALIVDGAWGAHFGFHPDLPASPVRQGADIVIMSTHKMASSLHQSALLHLGDTPLADALEPALDRAYRMTASTSESSLLLGSIDVARRDLQRGRAGIGDALRNLDLARRRIRAEDGISLIEDTFSAYPDIIARDPFRVPIDVSGLGVNAQALRLALAREQGIWAEMATQTTLVPLLGAGKRTSFDALIDALVARAQPGRATYQPDDPGELPPPGPVHLTPREAFYAPSVVVSAEAAIGRISADALAAYPPGIPNILPGEEITAAALGFLQSIAASPGGFVRGSLDEGVSILRVIATG